MILHAIYRVKIRQSISENIPSQNFALIFNLYFFVFTDSGGFLEIILYLALILYLNSKQTVLKDLKKELLKKFFKIERSDCLKYQSK